MQTWGWGIKILSGVKSS